MMKDTQINGPVNNKAFVNPIRYFIDLDIDFKLILLFVLFTIIFIYVPYLNSSILRILFGFVFIFFLPGYAFISMIYPGKKGIGSVERALFSFVLSIAFVPLIGMAFNFTQWGVKLEPITLALAIFTIACTLIANKRRQGILKEERFSIDTDIIFGGIRKTIFRPDESRTVIAFSTLLFILLAITIGQITYMAIMSDHGEKYTELYLTGPDGMFGNYTKDIAFGEKLPVTVWIGNHEFRDMDYDMIVRLDNGIQSNTVYSGHIDVANDRTLERTIDITPDLPGNDLKLSFQLFTEENFETPYRECYLWLNVTGPME